jgi:hypothetical protein
VLILSDEVIGILSIRCLRFNDRGVNEDESEWTKPDCGKCVIKCG